MTCQDVEMLLMEYAAGELDAATSGELEQHLESCDSCCRELEREKMLAETLGNLPTGNTELPGGFFYPTRGNQWWLPASGGLVAAAVLLTVLLAGQSNNKPPAAAIGPGELAAATEEVRWALTLTSNIIQKNKQETLRDLFGTKIPTALTGSLFPKQGPEDGNRS